MGPDTDEMLRSVGEEYRDLRGTRREVRRSDRLSEDLEIDSLLAQELLDRMEDRLGIEVIGDPRLAEITTAGQLAELLEELTLELPDARR